MNSAPSHKATRSGVMTQRSGTMSNDITVMMKKTRVETSSTDLVLAFGLQFCDSR